MTAMPGRNYQVFFTNPNTATDLSVYHTHRVKRFFFNDTITVDDYESRHDAIRGFIPGYEILTDRDGEASLETESGSSRVPSWTLGTDMAHELRALAEQRPPMVVIRSPFPAATAQGWTKRQSVVLRELWETVRDMPGTQFIITGEYEYRLWWLFGFSGGVIKLRDGSSGMGKVTRVIQGDGRIMQTKDMAPSDHAAGYLDPAISGATLAPERAALVHETSGQGFRFPEGETRRAMAGLGGMRDSVFLGMPNGATAWTVEGDRIRCNECSVHLSCTLYQEGSVCAMPTADGRRLSSFFDTRDSGKVIEGVAQILQFQAHRFERLVEDEGKQWDQAEETDQPLPEPSREVSKMANDIQRNAERYAKLIDPSLSRPMVAVQVNSGSGQVEMSRAQVTPKLIATAARELEASGTPRSEQTTDMIYKHIAMDNGGAVIEGETVNGLKEDF